MGEEAKAHSGCSSSFAEAYSFQDYGKEERIPRKRWTLEQLKCGNTFLSMQAATNKFDSQCGMTAPGMPRWNIVRDKQLGYIEPDRRSENVLRVQCGTNQYASQKGETPMGASRCQVPRVTYKKDWETVLDKEGEKIIPKQAGDYGLATQAGEVSMGAHRNQVPNVRGRLPHDRRTHGVLVFQNGTNIFASQTGMTAPPGIGAVRQATQRIEGLDMTEDQQRRGTEYTPWYSGQNKFATQAGSGGFLKVRDVILHTKGGKEIDDSLKQKSEGIVPLQSGTNKLASQRGMTGFGSPRNTIQRTGWKKEWIEEYEAALKEWEETKPPGSASSADPFGHYKKKFEERE
ncbi:calponin family repeat-containing domain protein [Ostertagia ostertagi]